MINLIAKLFGMKIVALDNECPFEPDHINGRPIIAKFNGKAIIG